MSGEPITRSSTGSKQPHGLTVAEARTYRKGKLCRICGTAEDLTIDHDHVTGRIRGVLCQGHNRGLGHFHDSISELLAAVAHLQEPADPDRAN